MKIPIFTRRKAAQIIAEKLSRLGHFIISVNSPSFPEPSIELSQTVLLIHKKEKNQKTFENVVLKIISKTDGSKKAEVDFNIYDDVYYRIIEKTVGMDYEI